jgi:8-oxo-dGTP diphosphatase
MLFRLRTYRVEVGRLAAFNEFFLERLLPIQLKHGARLVGRFQSRDGSTVYALWAYESEASFEEIDRRVRDDPESASVQDERRLLDPLVSEMTEEFLASSIPLARTELAHLAAS